MNKQTHNERIKNLRAKGVPVKEIAERYNISEPRVYQITGKFREATIDKGLETPEGYEWSFKDYTTPQERKRPKAHPLNDSPWVWLAAPALLVAYLVIGWVMSLV